MAPSSQSSDDNVSTSSQPPHLPLGDHINTPTYRYSRAVSFTSSHRATPRPGSRPFPRANNPINLSSSQTLTQGMRRLTPDNIHLSTRGHGSDGYQPNAAWVQTGEEQSTSGSSNTTPWRLDRHREGQVSTDSRRRRDREERKRQRHLQRRLKDNRNPAASQSMEAICVLDTRYVGERVLVPAQSLFCRHQKYSAVHPNFLQRLGIVPRDVPPGTGKAFIGPNGRCDAKKYTDLVIDHRLYNIRGELEHFLVLGKDVPHKGVDIYISQRFLDKYFDGNLPPHLPPDSAASGQAVHWPVGITGSSQNVIGGEDMTPNTAIGGSGLGLHRFYDVPVTPMVALPVRPIWDTTGTPGYSTAPLPLEQWESSPALQGGFQYPIRPNDLYNGAAFGTQPNMGQFQQLNITRLNPNGPTAHFLGQSPSTLNQGYLGENMMPQDTIHGSGSHWCQAPE